MHYIRGAHIRKYQQCNTNVLATLNIYRIVTVNVLCTIIKVREYPGAQVCEVLYQGAGEGVPL